jgi:uncharacterized membrane protein YvlD (DUF360 family)
MFLADSQSNVVYIITGIIVSLINIPISLLFSKLKKPLVFLVPGLLFIVTIYFAYSAIIYEDFGRAIAIIYAVMVGIAFIATLASSSIIYIMMKKKEKELSNPID